MFLFNTLTNIKEKFIPINEKIVNIYCCGPTVYNFMHLGNARPIIIFDILNRYLTFNNYTVNFVQNFTDIDDKIITIANEMNVSYKCISTLYINEYFKDIEGLKVKKANHYPKVTEIIPEIINSIKVLIDKDMAYVVNKSVYFKTSKFKNYGKLSNNKVDQLIFNDHIIQKKVKQNIIDFVLWKNCKECEPGWKSPWGIGRPGWHIECSAIIAKYFNNTTIDIHCGGVDLIFPHHENEIAQSETLYNYPLAKYWLHNGFVNINDKKLSKSKNNFFSLRSLAEKYGYNVIRLFIISSHYKNDINFKEELLINSSSALKRIKTFKILIDYYYQITLKIKKNNNLINYKEIILENQNKFFDAMNDDINTADALAVVFELIKKINIIIMQHKNILSHEFFKKIKSIFQTYCDILGIFFDNKEYVFDDKIRHLINLRNKYKKEKNYLNSDIIRKKLFDDYKIEIRDTKDGNYEIFFN